VPVPSLIVRRFRGGTGRSSSIRKQTLVLVLITGLIAAALTNTTGCGSDHGTIIHDDVALFPFELWDGTETTLAGLVAEDGRPLVVNLWATWCTPCLEEMPDLQKVHETHGDLIRLVGLNISDSPTRAEARADEIGITYLLGRDSTGMFSEALGAVGLPVTAFVDATGRVIQVHHGPMDVEALTSAVEKNLGMAPND